jgi:hypothetical protein
MTELDIQPTKRIGKYLLTFVAVPVGALVAWLTLLGALYIPVDSPAVWLGVPALTLAGLTWLLLRRARWWAALFAASGVLALGFSVFLFWQFGQGMENLD